MADLIDMRKFADWNDGYTNILLVIDTFSKFVWLRPLKNKKGSSVAEAFQDILQTSGRSPAKLITDKGQEFRAEEVQILMRQYEVAYFPTQNEQKASTSERAILTIKRRLYRYFSYTENYSYLSVLQDFAESYNHSYHRTIGMKPSDVKHSNSEEVRLSTYFAREKADKKYQQTRQKRFLFKVGDYVRISHLKTVFSRAYDETYTGEPFKVSKRYYRGTLPVYRLKDMMNEDIKGTFYQSELQKIYIDPDQYWKVDKVLKRRGKGKNRQLFVSWKFFPRKFNSWILASDLQ